MTFPTDHLPKCDRCLRPAIHFYCDIREVGPPDGPHTVTGADGRPRPVWYRRWRPDLRYRRCDDHADTPDRIYADGRREPIADPYAYGLYEGEADAQ